jgi:hypothetical protein
MPGKETLIHFAGSDRHTGVAYEQKLTEADENSF